MTLSVRSCYLSLSQSPELLLPLKDITSLLLRSTRLWLAPPRTDPLGSDSDLENSRLPNSAIFLFHQPADSARAGHDSLQQRRVRSLFALGFFNYVAIAEALSR